MPIYDYGTPVKIDGHRIPGEEQKWADKNGQQFIKAVQKKLGRKLDDLEITKAYIRHVHKGKLNKKTKDFDDLVDKFVNSMENQRVDVGGL